MEYRLAFIFWILLIGFVSAQEKIADELLIIQDSKIEKQSYDPLGPSKAAFYSAVLPGLGQAYNKKYWKIPLVYASIGTSLYFHNINKKDYDRFRGIYKRRLEGFTDDEYWGEGSTPNVSNERLRDAQKTAQRNKDLSIAVAVGFYLLNILDANVDAHLRQFNLSKDLSVQPNFEIDALQGHANYGLSINFKL